MILLTHDRVEHVFNKSIDFYTRLYIRKSSYEKMENKLSGLDFIGFGFLKGKMRGYPREILELYDIINMFLSWADISDRNKQIIQSGVRTYIYMIREEADDINRQEDLSTESISMILSFLHEFRQESRLLLKKGNDGNHTTLSDLYPQAPGKDMVNEFNFAREPQAHTQTDEGRPLDTIRHRDNTRHPACSGYDYEYAKVGFDIKLQKAKDPDYTKEYAHSTATAQIIKGYTLILCSMHYCREYKHYKGAFSDIIRKDTHIVTNMTQSEINPYIQRFNSHIAFKDAKDSLERYRQGLSVKIQPFIRLNLIDESIERYYREYQNYYFQLSEESKLRFDLIVLEKGRLSAHKTYYTHKTYANAAAAHTAMRENALLSDGSLQHILLPYATSMSGNDAIFYVKGNNPLIIYYKYADDDPISEEAIPHSYTTQTLDVMDSTLRYKVILKRDVDKSFMQQQTQAIKAQLKKELKLTHTQHENLTILRKHKLID